MISNLFLTVQSPRSRHRPSCPCFAHCWSTPPRKATRSCPQPPDPRRSLSDLFRFALYTLSTFFLTLLHTHINPAAHLPSMEGSRLWRGSANTRNRNVQYWSGGLGGLTKNYRFCFLVSWQMRAHVHVLEERERESYAIHRGVRSAHKIAIPSEPKGNSRSINKDANNRHIINCGLFLPHACRISLPDCQPYVTRPSPIYFSCPSPPGT